MAKKIDIEKIAQLKMEQILNENIDQLFALKEAGIDIEKLLQKISEISQKAIVEEFMKGNDQ